MKGQWIRNQSSWVLVLASVYNLKIILLWFSFCDELTDRGGKETCPGVTTGIALSQWIPGSVHIAEIFRNGFLCGSVTFKDRMSRLNAVFLMKAVDSSASLLLFFWLRVPYSSAIKPAGFWKRVFLQLQRKKWNLDIWGIQDTGTMLTDPSPHCLGFVLYSGEERSLSMNWACLELELLTRHLQVEAANVSCTSVQSVL